MTWGERVGEHLVDMGSPLENDGDADVQVSGYSRRLGAVRPFSCLQSNPQPDLLLGWSR
jgi:hypothetical protein